MTLTTPAQESARQGAFYVPRFQVKVSGANLPKDVLFDVRTLIYSDSIDQIDSFQIEVNNWDDVAHEFKYIGSDTAQPQSGDDKDKDKRSRWKLFEPCDKEVEIFMGYGDNFVSMLKGNFTTMAPTFTDGPPILTVTGLNVLHQLRRKPYSYGWGKDDTHQQGWKNSEIAQNLQTLTDPETGKRRFPLDIRIDKEAAKKESTNEFVMQRNLTDIEFLLQRARTEGYVVNLEVDKNNKQRLYFGPSADATEVTYQFTWGRSLMEFKPKLATAKQVRSVTVNGWDRATKKPVTSKASLDHGDPKVKVNEDLFDILNACDPHEEVVVDEPVTTVAQAQARAEAILKDQIKQVVTVESVKVVGLPNLRSGRVVALDGVGSRLNGTYFITKTTHTINDSGYITTFDCRREQFPGGRPSS
jgi:uncharacterized protein